MTKPARSLVVAAVAVGAVVLLTVVLWKPGQDASWDSATYLDGARRIAAGEGYVTSRGALEEPSGIAPIVLWPPGFSMAIALGVAFGADPLVASAWVLALSYAVCVAACFACTYLTTRSPALAALAALFFALMPGTLESLDAVLSDLPFAAAVAAGGLLAAIVAERERPSVGLQLSAGLAMGSCFWFRYVGLGVVAGACGALLFARRESGIWSRARRLATTLSTCVVVCALLVVRNLRVGSPTGGHGIEFSSILRNAGFALEGCAQAVAPSWGIAHVIALVVVLVAVSATLALGIRLRVYRVPSVCVVSGIFVAYAGSLLLSASLTAFNTLDETRFWVPFWLTYAMFAPPVLQAARGAYRRWIALPALGGMAACIVAYVVTVAFHLRSAQRLHELSEVAWRKAAALLPDASECRLLSNDVRPFLVHRPLAPNARLPDDRRSMNTLRNTYPKLCIAFVKGWTPWSSRLHRRAQEVLIKAMSNRRQLSLIAQDPLVDVYRVKP